MKFPYYKHSYASVSRSFLITLKLIGRLILTSKESVKKGIYLNYGMHILKGFLYLLFTMHVSIKIDIKFPLKHFKSTYFKE